MTKIKHVWDPTAKAFLPKIPTQKERLKNVWKKSVERIQKLTKIQTTIIIAFILRLYQLGKGAFWYDEGVTVVLSRLPWDKMIQATAGDVHPPGYYIIIWLLARTGIPLTEGIARLPSLIFSLIGIYLTWKLVDRPEISLSNVGKYIIIAWIIISPLQLHYAQESRMYSLLQVEVLAGILFILDRRKLLFSLILIAMLYTHNYAVFYIPTFAVVALINEYGDYLLTFKPLSYNNWYGPKRTAIMYAKKWLPWFIIPVIAWVPWAIILFEQMGTVAGGYWIQPVKLPAIIFVLYQMMFAYSMPPTFQGLGVLLTMGILIYTAWRIYRDRPRGWLMLSMLSFGPLLLSVFVSIVWKPVLLFRGLIGTAVPLSILVVTAIEGIRVPYKRIYAYFLIGATLGAGLYGHYTYNAENKGTTTTWVHNIVEQAENGDAIVALNDNGVIAMKTYAPGVPMYKLIGCGEEPLGSLSAKTRKAIGVEERRIEQLLPLSAGNDEPLQVYTRIYFISTVSPISPECEVEVANDIISWDNVRLIHELANSEFTQAGVYLITTREKY